MTGKEYWRSLDQLADTPEFREKLAREFPENSSELADPVTRRGFLRVMGASMALAWLSGCRRPIEKIVPYVKAPESTVLGVPQYYATTMPFGNNAFGLLVETHEGRPTKVEGNDFHSTSYGSSNAFVQASILNLYDPDRSDMVLKNGNNSTWDQFIASWKPLFDKYGLAKGEGLAILSEPTSSPTQSRLKKRFGSLFPKAKWVTYEPVSDENIVEGIQTATGKKYQPEYRFDNAKMILSLDSDFLLMESNNIINSQRFADSRHVDDEHGDMSRLYTVESGFTITGAMADHRMRLQSRQIGAFAAALGLELQVLGVEIQVDLSNYSTHQFDRKWLKALAKDLIVSKGESVILAGRRQPASVHALVTTINAALGNNGKTINYRELEHSETSSRTALRALTDDMKGKSISTLVILGGNPVYNAPVDLEFKSALKSVEHTVHISSSVDETSRNVEWHLPQSHFLESWGDARSIDGSLSVIQPMIEPLFGGHSTIELLNVLITGESVRGHDLVQETWREIVKESDFNSSWRRVLHDGLLENETELNIKPSINKDAVANLIDSNPFPTDKADAKNLEVVFQADPSVYDGKYANNGWLQELPDPITKLMWDNAAIMSPRTAKEMGVETQDVVRLTYRGRSLNMAVHVLPGQADYSITLPLGYGRTAGGRVADGPGFDTYKLRTVAADGFGIGLTINLTKETYKLANSQEHSAMEGRPLIREGTLEEYKHHPEFAQEMVHVPELQSLWKEHKYDEGYQWGMTIDLNRCTGCNACVIGCQSENNIPIVGKDPAAYGREMHWIRMDRYFNGDENNPEMVHQPVACHHCEMAPCEQVCPVAATTHDKEGLNNMVYNRCIGTRYCSNNCPYKVRRFNFFNYTKEIPEIVQMAQNPDVTVRSRGVMEKCTYCLQRINRSKHNAKRNNTTVADGDIVTACQQACPTNAILFGNVNDPNSEVSKIKKQNRNYEMLAEYNLRPRTSYLAKLRNPNPELV